jgi:thiamine pyrophosphokinase
MPAEGCDQVAQAPSPVKMEGFFLQALIVANGDITAWDHLPNNLRNAGLIIAVDGGWHHCQTLGINADVVIGDFDSLTASDLKQLEESKTQLKKFPPEKDEIDLELALLYAVDQGAREINILGGLGGRFDMSIANISLMLLPQLQGVSITFWHHRQKVWLIQPPGGEILGKAGDTLSLLPLGGESRGIHTKNLAYALEDEDLPFGPARGVSNLLTAEVATISLEKGTLLAVWTPGKA